MWPLGRAVQGEVRRDAEVAVAAQGVRTKAPLSIRTSKATAPGRWARIRALWTCLRTFKFVLMLAFLAGLAMVMLSGATCRCSAWMICASIGKRGRFRPEP